MLQLQVTLLTAWWAAGDALHRRIDDDRDRALGRLQFFQRSSRGRGGRR